MKKFKLSTLLVSCLILGAGCSDDDSSQQDPSSPTKSAIESDTGNQIGPGQADRDAQAAAEQAKQHDPAETQDSVLDQSILAPGSAAQKDADAAPFTLAIDYHGEELTLMKDHPKHWGQISIRGGDAQALFERLAIAPVTGKEPQGGGWLPAQIKNGYDLSCYQQALRATPDQPKYTCVIFIDYRSGDVLRHADHPLWATGTRPLERSYQGPMLLMQLKDHQPLARVRLGQEDSHMLFMTMERNVRQGFHTVDVYQQKIGEDLNCTSYVRNRHAANMDPVYSCQMYFDFTSGQAIGMGPGQTTKPKVVEGTPAE